MKPRDADDIKRLKNIPSFSSFFQTLEDEARAGVRIIFAHAVMNEAVDFFELSDRVISAVIDAVRIELKARLGDRTEVADLADLTEAAIVAAAEREMREVILHSTEWGSA